MEASVEEVEEGWALGSRSVRGVVVGFDVDILLDWLSEKCGLV